MKYAGFWVRLAASLIDYAFVLLFAVPVAMMLGYSLNEIFSDRNNLVYDVFETVLEGVITVAFLISTWQATIGKRVLGIHIIDIKGANISVGLAIKRYLITTVTLLPILSISYLLPAPTDRIKPDLGSSEIN